MGFCSMDPADSSPRASDQGLSTKNLSNKQYNEFESHPKNTDQIPL